MSNHRKLCFLSFIFQFLLLGLCSGTLPLAVRAIPTPGFGTSLQPDLPPPGLLDRTDSETGMDLESALIQLDRDNKGVSEVKYGASEEVSLLSPSSSERKPILTQPSEPTRNPKQSDKLMQTIFMCGAKEIRACLDNVAASWPTFSPAQKLAILISVSRTNPSDPLILGFKKSPLIPAAEKLVVIYAYHTYRSMSNIVSSMQDLERQMDASSVLLSETAREIIQDALEFNKRSELYLNHMKNDGLTSARKRVEFGGRWEAGVEKVQRNLNTLRRLRQQIVHAKRDQEVRAAVSEYLVSVSLDLSQFEGVVQQYQRRLETAMESKELSGSEKVLTRLLDPSLEEVVALAIYRKYVDTLWITLFKNRRFDILSHLVRRGFVFNFAYDKQDRVSLLKTAIQSIAATPKASHPSWPSNNRVIEFLMEMSHHHLKYSGWRRDVVALPKDVD